MKALGNEFRINSQESCILQDIQNSQSPFHTAFSAYYSGRSKSFIDFILSDR